AAAVHLGAGLAECAAPESSPVANSKQVASPRSWVGIMELASEPAGPRPVRAPPTASPPGDSSSWPHGDCLVPLRTVYRESEEGPHPRSGRGRAFASLVHRNRASPARAAPRRRGYRRQRPRGPRRQPGEGARRDRAPAPRVRTGGGVEGGAEEALQDAASRPVLP